MGPFSGVLELLIFKFFGPLRPNRDTKLSLNPQRGPFNVKMLPPPLWHRFFPIFLLKNTSKRLLLIDFRKLMEIVFEECKWEKKSKISLWLHQNFRSNFLQEGNRLRKIILITHSTEWMITFLITILLFLYSWSIWKVIRAFFIISLFKILIC